jgi:hypothetical protein
MSLQVGIVKYEFVPMEEKIAIYSEEKAGTLDVGALRCRTDGDLEKELGWSRSCPRVTYLIAQAGPLPQGLDVAAERLSAALLPQSTKHTWVPAKNLRS